MSKADELIAKARSFIGQGYWSMHNGALDGQGFGCAMLVAACYNAVFTDGAYCSNTGEIGRGGAMHTDSKGRGCYGSTYNFYGEVSDKSYHQYKMGTWTKTTNPKPGDVVCFIHNGSPASRATSCDHVALYIGNGRIIGAWGSGKASYVQGRRGVIESSIDYQTYNTYPVYIHCSLLDEDKKPTGWIEEDGKWWYRHADGSYTKQDWESIKGKWYYFDKDGWMVTGWLKDDGIWYYLNKDGAMVTGWQLIDKKWYYFNTTGAMQKSTCIQWKGKWCALGKDGAMLYEVKADKDGYLLL